MFVKNLIAPVMANSEELSEKIDQLLYGQAVLSLRQKFPSPAEEFTMADIRKEQAQLKSEYVNRFKNEPPSDSLFRQL